VSYTYTLLCLKKRKTISWRLLHIAAHPKDLLQAIQNTFLFWILQNITFSSVCFKS
jgi:hypothetical protein